MAGELVLWKGMSSMVPLSPAAFNANMAATENAVNRLLERINGGEITITDGSITDMMLDRLTAKRIVIDTADIANAAITNLKIDRATANRLVVTDADIAIAAIGSAHIQEASITNAHIDRATAQRLQVVEADFAEVLANKVFTGEISTERLIIRDPVDPTKSIIYEINNITGALQAVQGDTLNGEVITERTITADRIVAESITVESGVIGSLHAGKLITGRVQGPGGVSYFDLDTGHLKAVDAELSGYVNASSGQIGNLIISDTALTLTVPKVFGPFAQADLDRVNGIVMGSITPTADDYDNYDFYGTGRLTALNLTEMSWMINGTNGRTNPQTVNYEMKISMTDTNNLISLKSDKFSYNNKIRPGSVETWYGIFNKLETSSLKAAGIECTGAASVGGQLDASGAANITGLLTAYGGIAIGGENGIAMPDVAANNTDVWNLRMASGSLNYSNGTVNYEVLDSRNKDWYVPAMGLGGNCLDISGQNVKVARNTGFFMGYNCPSAPSANTWWYYIYLRYSDAYCCVIAIPLDTTGQIQWINKRAGTWQTSWSQIES